MVYWDTDQLAGGEVERLYGAWEGRQQEWHDQVELGERVAEAFAAADSGIGGPIPKV